MRFLHHVRRDDFEAAHIGTQDGGDDDGAVGLLVVFEDGHHGTAGGKAGAVQGMHEFRLAAALGTEADIGAAGLEVHTVGAGRDLAVHALTGQPHFHVVGLGGTEAHVAGAEGDGTVGQFQLFEQDLGAAAHIFQLVPGLVGMGEAHHLHLGELMLADEAAHVFAGGTGFGTEAGGAGGVAQAPAGFGDLSGCPHGLHRKAPASSGG